MTQNNVQLQNGNGPLAGLRNQIINGDFRVWQYGETSTAVGYNTADRWYIDFSGTGCTTSKVLVTDNYHIKFVCDNLTNMSLETRLEANDVRRFLNKQMTLSFYTTAAAPDLRIDTYNESQQGTIVKNWNTPALTYLGDQRWSYTFTVTVNGIHLGTLPTDRAMDILLSPVQRGNMAVDNYEFWNVQLEPGPIATPPEDIPIALELSLCQRYYQRHETAGDYRATALRSNVTTGTQQISLPVTMRVTPTSSVITQPSAPQLIRAIDDTTGVGYTTLTVDPKNENVYSFVANAALSSASQVLIFGAVYDFDAEL